MIRSVLEVQPRMSSGGSGKTSDEIVYELAESILGKLPDILDMENAQKDLFKVKIKFNFLYIQSIWQLFLVPLISTMLKALEFVTV